MRLTRAFERDISLLSLRRSPLLLVTLPLDGEIRLTPGTVRVARCSVILIVTERVSERH